MTFVASGPQGGSTAKPHGGLTGVTVDQWLIAIVIAVATKLVGNNNRGGNYGQKAVAGEPGLDWHRPTGGCQAGVEVVSFMALLDLY